MANSNVNWSGKEAQPTQLSGQSLFPGQTPSPIGQTQFGQPSAPSQPVTPIMPGPFQTGQPAPGAFRQAPPPTTDMGYIPGFLASNIGKSVRAEFIVGSNQYVDKTGILSAVGINYFVLQDVNSRTFIMCDLYSVRFVTFLVT